MGDPGSSTSLDPADWGELRRDGHRMLDDMLNHLATLRDQPVWQAPPPGRFSGLHEALPRTPTALRDVHARFLNSVLPYSSGNAHPGFMGWVQGGGTPVGMLAEMLSAGMNANVGGRHHMAIEVERQVVAWTRDLFGFPVSASGLFVTGTSAANLMGVLVARTRALGQPVRDRGLAAMGATSRPTRPRRPMVALPRRWRFQDSAAHSFGSSRWARITGSRSPHSKRRSPRIARMGSSRSC
jgi:aromatic-L-amino-acid decarboxylase